MNAAIGLMGLAGLTLAAYGAENIAPLFPFVISYDGPENASSVAHFLDAPAGKHGFVRAERGHFATDAGPLRFHATNLTGPANFPKHADADKLAARLARLGINCVRLHFMDTWYVNFMPKPTQAILADDTHTQRNLDPGQLEKLDYMIAAFKKRGIYVDMNLHVGRTLDERDGFQNAKALPWADKSIGQFEPRMIELQKEYARKLLTHVNPYTGNAYTDEPGVAMIEISNEDGLIGYYYGGSLERLPEPYAGELRRQWNDWLHAAYGDEKTFRAAWAAKNEPLHDEQIAGKNGVLDFANRAVPTVGTKEDPLPMRARRDFVLFLYDAETRYWTGMASYVRSELKAKQPVSGTQLGYSPAYVQAKLDYVDSHAYWRHPSGGWISLTAKTPWEIGNDAMVNSLGCIVGLAGQRVLGKPYTVSEYNHPYPNQFGAEGQTMLAAYGRLQGWDGIFQYSYNHYVNDFEPQALPWCFFDLLARTDVLAHFPACSAMFLRGDVGEAKETIVASADAATCRDRLIARRSNEFSIGTQGYDSRLVALHKTGVSFDGDKPARPVQLPPGQKVFVSDTGELVWNKEKTDAAYLAVNTANTKLFTGFPEGRTVELGTVALSIGKTRLNWATVSLVSRLGTGFGEKGAPANILLAATGDAGNAGRIIKDLGNKKITLTDRGGAPVLVEGIPATVTLPSDPAKTRCYALDPHGDRKTEVPVEKAEGGSKIAIAPSYQTVWYEIDVR